MTRKDIEVNLKVLSRVEVMNALRSWVIRQMKEVVSGASANCERQYYPAWVLVTTRESKNAAFYIKLSD